MSPAGGINATTSDIAKFMIAHLQNGEYNGKNILNNLEKAAPAFINIENSFFNKFYPSNGDKITSKNNMSYDEGNLKKV